MGGNFSPVSNGRKFSFESLVNSGAELFQTVNNAIHILGILEPAARLLHVGCVMEEMLHEVIVTLCDGSSTEADRDQESELQK